MSSDPTSSVPLAVDPYDAYAFLSLLAEGIVWGFYSFLCYTCISMLYSLRKTTSTTVPLTVITIGLYILCTAHFALLSYSVTSTLWATGIVGAGYANYVTVSADVIAAFTCFFGDLTLIYRLSLFYRTYRWRWLVVLFVSVLDLAGLAISLTCNSAIINIFTSGSLVISPDSFNSLWIAYIALPLCTNLLIALLISGRAIYFWRQLSYAPSLGPRASRALIVIVESGLLFVIVQIALMVFHQLQFPATVIIFGIAAQVYGIAPTMITAGIASGILTELPQEQSNSTGVGTLTLPAFAATHTSFTYQPSYEKPEYSVSTTDGPNVHVKSLDSPV